MERSKDIDLVGKGPWRVPLGRGFHIILHLICCNILMSTEIELDRSGIFTF